jgi:uncharacterized protein (UPF0264 family)
MRLLVSVADARDAAAALAGGADLIDAKDPGAGALGAVTPRRLREISASVAGARPLTAALGDAGHEAEVERNSRWFAAAGAALVKVGFSGTADLERVAALVAAARRGAAQGSGGRSGVIAVAYADADRATSPGPLTVLEAAGRSAARGVLIDTADKAGPGLRQLVTPSTLAAWVAGAHRRRLVVTLAGKLTAEDLPFVRDLGADVAGVRSAACTGGRAGRVDAATVRRLRTLCGAPAPLTA